MQQAYKTAFIQDLKKDLKSSKYYQHLKDKKTPKDYAICPRLDRKTYESKIQLKVTNSQSAVLIRQSSPVLDSKLCLRFSKTCNGSVSPGNTPYGQLWLIEHLAT